MSLLYKEKMKTVNIIIVGIFLSIALAAILQEYEKTTYIKAGYHEVYKGGVWLWEK